MEILPESGYFVGETQLRFKSAKRKKQKKKEKNLNTLTEKEADERF